MNIHKLRTKKIYNIGPWSESGLVGKYFLSGGAPWILVMEIPAININKHCWIYVLNGTQYSILLYKGRSHKKYHNHCDWHVAVQGPYSKHFIFFETY